MNKDVIYIEPEDDITDIITKIEKSKEKIVAIVPPKKAGVFRSIVNIKLIAKAGISAGKTVVLVTVDPSIMKLAGATKIPVAKNLQSAPAIPSVQSIDTEAANVVSATELAEAESVKTASSSEPSSSEPEVTESEEESIPEPDEDEDDEDDLADEKKPKEEDLEKKSAEKAQKPAKKPEEKHGHFSWIRRHKKTTAFLVLCLFGITGFLVWAFAFAPKVDFTVSIETESKNFSEGITMTTNLADENATEGKFYIEQVKVEVPQEVTFQATGVKNVGEKASGTVVISAYFPVTAGKSAVAAKKTFTINNLTYTTSDDTSLSWSGDLNKLSEECDNYGNASLNVSGCQKTKRIKVIASEGGTKYNIGASKAWDSTNVSVYSDAAMSGGTDSTITVVQQSDIESAKAKLTTSSETENKTSLYTKIGSGKLIIESSFNQTTAEAEVTPKVDEQVPEGTTPTVKVTTTATVFVLDKAKLEEFIRAKVKLENEQKIYEIKDMYVESFAQVSNGYTARLKAQYYIGPSLKESDLINKVLGKGIGAAVFDIKSINGVTNVETKASYPWVSSVPASAEKVTMNITIRDKSGNVIRSNDELKAEEEKTEEKKSTEQKDSTSTDN